MAPAGIRNVATYTAEEQAAEERLGEAYIEVTDALALVTDKKARAAVDIAVSDLVLAQVEAAYHRLARILPHLRDVIAMSLLPEETELPGMFGGVA